MRTAMSQDEEERRGKKETVTELELASSFEHSPRKRICSTRMCGHGRWLHWGSEGPISRASEAV